MLGGHYRERNSANKSNDLIIGRTLRKELSEREKKGKEKKEGPISRSDIGNNRGKVSPHPLGKQNSDGLLFLARPCRNSARKDCPAKKIPRESNQSEEELEAPNPRRPLEYKSRAPLRRLDEWPEQDLQRLLEESVSIQKATVKL